MQYLGCYDLTPINKGISRLWSLRPEYKEQNTNDILCHAPFPLSNSCRMIYVFRVCQFQISHNQPSILFTPEAALFNIQV